MNDEEREMDEKIRETVREDTGRWDLWINHQRAHGGDGGPAFDFHGDGQGVTTHRDIPAGSHIMLNRYADSPMPWEPVLDPTDCPAGHQPIYDARGVCVSFREKPMTDKEADDYAEAEWLKDVVQSLERVDEGMQAMDARLDDLEVFAAKHGHDSDNTSIIVTRLSEVEVDIIKQVLTRAHQITRKKDDV